jgi:DNA-binding CsgD family transcriptional regulator
MTEDYLSDKEYIVLDSLARGLSNQEISEQQGISVNTVKFHLKNIYRRLKLKNRVEAAGWFRDQSNHQN